MKAIFALLFYLLLLPLVFAHEHTNDALETDRTFLDNLQRPDNRPDERFDKKSIMLHRQGCHKSRIQDGVPEGAKYPELRYLGIEVDVALAIAEQVDV